MFLEKRNKRKQLSKTDNMKLSRTKISTNKEEIQRNTKASHTLKKI